MTSTLTLNDREQYLLEKINAEVMTDEESSEENGSRSLILRKLPWRSDKVNHLISKIDETVKGKFVLQRKEGNNSERVASNKIEKELVKENF